MSELALTNLVSPASKSAASARTRESLAPSRIHLRKRSTCSAGSGVPPMGIWGFASPVK